MVFIVENDIFIKGQNPGETGQGLNSKALKTKRRIKEFEQILSVENIFLQDH